MTEITVNMDNVLSTFRLLIKGEVDASNRRIDIDCKKITAETPTNIAVGGTNT